MSHNDRLNSAEKVVTPRAQEFFWVRAPYFFRPDVLWVRASKGRLYRGKTRNVSVSDRVRVLTLEWCPVKSADYANARVERIDRLGPEVRLEELSDRVLVLAQDLLCTVENPFGEPITVSVSVVGARST